VGGTCRTQAGDKKSIQNFDRKTSSPLGPYILLGTLFLNILLHIRRIRRTNPCAVTHTRNLRVLAPSRDSVHCVQMEMRVQGG
jgi:hypothetical protein